MVSYLNARGERVAIPPGDCVIIEEHMTGPFIVYWHEGGLEHSTALNLREWAGYFKSSALTIVE